jgi:hypothetical protein
MSDKSCLVSFCKEIVAKSKNIDDEEMHIIIKESASDEKGYLYAVAMYAYVKGMDSIIHRLLDWPEYYDWHKLSLLSQEVEEAWLAITKSVVEWAIKEGVPQDSVIAWQEKK